MSQPEPSSQGSTDTQGTQEIYSQESFNQIWHSLERTFSSPDKIIQGFMTDELPFKVEFKDENEADNLEVTYEQRTVRSNLGMASSLTQSLTDLLQPLQPVVQSPVHSLVEPLLHQTQTMNNRDVNAATMLNGNGNNNVSYEPTPLQLILPNNNFPGQFDFKLAYEANKGPITKATPCVYVADREKLFVKMMCVCPVIFKIKGNPPCGSGIRGILMYKKPESCKDIVRRCPNHMNTITDGHPYPEHVMRCENPSTIYETCPKTNRLSLFVPLSALNPVDGGFKELFKFMCFNSCVGGMNRRPTCLLFRLECGGVSYGRAVVEVRICASPGRDMNEKEPLQKNAKNTDNRNEPSSTTDDTNLILVPQHSSTATNPPRASVLMSTSKDPTSAPEPFQFANVKEQQNKRQYPFGTDGLVFKKVKMCTADSSDDEIYTIRVRGKERFDILTKVSDGLHFMDGVVPPPHQHSNGCTNSAGESSQEFTRIQQKMPSVEVKKEKPESSQCNITDVSPQSSQENCSQLSRTSSNASSQGSATHGPEYSALKLTMKRTISLKKAGLNKEAFKENFDPSSERKG